MGGYKNRRICWKLQDKKLVNSNRNLPYNKLMVKDSKFEKLKWRRFGITKSSRIFEINVI